MLPLTISAEVTAPPKLYSPEPFAGPLIGGSFTTRDVQALWPSELYPQLKAEGLSSAKMIAEVLRKLAHVLPAAASTASAETRRQDAAASVPV